MTEMFTITGDASYLKLARKIADEAIETLVYPNGVLREPNEPDCNADQLQFKGIFMRHLYRLYCVSNEPRYQTFIVKNARSILEHALKPHTYKVGLVWQGPFDKSDPGRQSSALDALNAAFGIGVNHNP